MSINKKLEIIQDFHDYIGKILAKGYMNDDSTLDNLIDIITLTDYKDEDNITLEESEIEVDVSDEEEESEEEKSDDDEEKSDEEEKTDEEEIKTETSEEEEDDESNEPVKKTSYLSLFSKKQPDPVYNTSIKIDDFITNKNKIDNVLLYKNNTSYVDRLSNYLQYITTY